MPRKPRFYLAGIPAHIVQRGNARRAVFFDDDDHEAYLDWLREGAAGHGCVVHAYVLMTNHMHLLMTPASPHAISRTIQYVGRHYVRYINRRYGRSGTLWEGRHKGCIVDSEHYLFACMRYIELNPVRAGMVDKPSDHPWSSYAANALGRSDELIVPHDRYRALGSTPAARQSAYRELSRAALDPDRVDEIRAAVQTGTPLGNDRFRQWLEQELGCRVGQARRGRPAEIRKGY